MLEVPYPVIALLVTFIFLVGMGLWSSWSLAESTSELRRLERDMAREELEAWKEHAEKLQHALDQMKINPKMIVIIDKSHPEWALALKKIADEAVMETLSDGEKHKHPPVMVVTKEL